MTNKTLPDGWQWKKLGDGCQINPPKSEVRNLEDCLVSFVPMADLKEKQKFFEYKQEKFLSEVYSGYTYFAENDVLLAKVTPCFENGKSGIARNLKNGKGFGSSEYYVLRGNENILKEWIYYTIANKSFLNLGAENMSGAVGLKRVTKDFLYNYPIPLPPLEEQKRIVAKIDAAFEQLDEAISLQKNNILRTETLKKALLVEQFSELPYEKKKLGEIAEVKRGKSKHRPRNDKSLFGGKYPFIQTGDVRGAAKYITEYSETYNEKGLEQSKLWKKGTVCLTIAANIGEVTILGIDACFPDSVVGIISSKNNNEFIYYYLTTLKTQLEAKATQAAQMNLNVEKLVEFEIPLPPIAEQEKIVAYLDKSFAEIDEMLEAQKTRLAHLEGMKKAILQEAFEGKL